VIGHQVNVTSDAGSFVTLADLWPAPCRAVIVGVNPAPRSVEAGHYYQGSDGRRALARLRSAGLLPTDRGGFAEDEALAAGIGFTDVVKRPTSRSSELTRAELEAGRTELRAKLETHHVGLVVCVFKPAVVALLGRAEPPGFQTRTLGPSRVFRMPGPYERAREAEAVMRQLASHLEALGGST
jgi:TDG/mug DNA glycosylase family protein